MQDLKQFLLMFVFILWSISMYACDGCGVNLSSTNGSLLNINNRSFISILGSQASFTSSPQSGHNISDSFYSTRLDARYAINDNWSVISGISYLRKIRTEDANDVILNGLGDLGIGINYSFSNEYNDEFTVFSEMGLRISIPTGKYNSQLHDIDLPQNFNLGIGSTGYGINSSVAIKKQNSGIILTLAYLLNTKSESGYKIGNSMNIRSAIYRTITASEKVRINVNLGLQYEYQSQDKFANHNHVLASGSNALYFPIVAGVSIDKITILGEVSIPLKQNYINNELDAHSRFGIQVIYFLN